MPRKPIQRSNEHYYHITARSNNKEHFYLEKNEIWKIMIKALRELQLEHQLKIGAFVLMDNHFHLLILTPKLGIDRIMYFFMKAVTREIQKLTRRINKIFGGRYKGSLINSSAYLLNVYKYIYRNPVAAGLVELAEQYEYSTLNIYFNNCSNSSSLILENIVPMIQNDHAERVNYLLWINQSYKADEAESIKSGLKKTIFAYKKDYVTHRPVILNSKLCKKKPHVK